MSVLTLTSDNFKQEVRQATVPVLVDFYATWCGPCKMVGPIVDQLANQFSGKLKVGKVDVDDAQDLAAEFGVMSVPTLVFFKNGEKVNQVVGALPKDRLEKLINEIL